MESKNVLKEMNDRLQKEREMFKVKRRKYSERAARVEKINQISLCSVTVVELIYFVSIFFQMVVLKQGDISKRLPPLIILAVGMGINWVIFLKRRNSIHLRYAIILPFLIAYGWLGFIDEGPYSVVYVIPILLCYLLYYDIKCSGYVSVAVIALLVVRVAYAVANNRGAVNDSLSGLIILSLLTIVVVAYFWLGTRILKKFDHDTVHTMRDEQKLQQIMMNDILSIIEKTQAQVQEVADEMEHLHSSTEVVNRSLQEIAIGTQSTAESIQEQTVMTENIRTALGRTDENATAMEKEAESSAHQMRTSAEYMKEMQRQSEIMEQAGNDVAKAMQTLKEKVEAVSGITQVIFTISNQTNLLALNASIESARAGEAGRGFAVVADQIRQLAEQTKKSTEQIAQIAAELNADADTAATMVGNSVEATMEQKKIIVQNTTTFEEVEKRSEATYTKASDLNVEIEHLVTSNNRIVESIGQLSAVSEEVTASTQQATELSENNLKELIEAAEKVMEIKETVMQLQKYEKELKDTQNTKEIQEI